MIDSFVLLRKLIVFVLVAVVLPLICLLGYQTVDGASMRGKVSGVTTKSWGIAARYGIELIWFKLSGTLPIRNVIPGMGQNWIELSSGENRKSWGGCGLREPIIEGQEVFDLMIALADCESLSTTSKIGLGFYQLQKEQVDVIREIKELNLVNFGPGYYESVAYAYQVNLLGRGRESTKSLVQKFCARSYLKIGGGVVNQGKRECLVAVELNNVLGEFEPSNDDERRAVAIKAGTNAFLWALADQDLFSGMKVEMSNLMKANPVRQRKSGQVLANLQNWRSFYHSHASGRPVFKVWSKSWKSADLEVLNDELKKEKLMLISNEVWREVTYKK